MIIRTVLVPFIILLAPLLSAVEPPSCFFSLGTGSGTVHELVFFQDDILSELVWPLDSLTTITAGVSLPAGNAFVLSISAETGMLMTRQYMTDSDYMNLPGDSRKTHFSRHTADLDTYHEFSIALSRIFSVPVRGIRSRDFVTITPHLEFRWTSIAWTGRDGYKQYGESGGVYYPWDPDMEKIPFDGAVITWRVSRMMLLAALSASVPAGNRFHITGTISVTPLIYCTATDNHLLTNTRYKDTLVGGLFIEPTIRISCRITTKQTLFLSGSRVWMSDSRGDTLSGPIGSPPLYRNEDSAGMNMTRSVVQLGIISSL